MRSVERGIHATWRRIPRQPINLGKFEQNPSGRDFLAANEAARLAPARSTTQRGNKA